MEQLLVYLPAALCAVAMFMCIRMMRGHGDMPADQSNAEIAELREEIARLRAERLLSDRDEASDG